MRSVLTCSLKQIKEKEHLNWGKIKVKNYIFLPVLFTQTHFWKDFIATKQESDWTYIFFLWLPDDGLTFINVSSKRQQATKWDHKRFIWTISTDVSELAPLLSLRWGGNESLILVLHYIFPAASQLAQQEIQGSLPFPLLDIHWINTANERRFPHKMVINHNCL